MQMIKLELDEQRLRILCGLVSLAGSKLGDTATMLAAAEMLSWVQAQANAQVTPKETTV
jgi:hypothetical protein